jgi:peptidoglycan hydrolase-like protein with peptidoglycan-binding domain
MRALLVAGALVVIIGVVALVANSVRWQDDAPPVELGPSEAQQNRAEEQAVQHSEPRQQLSEVEIRRYQERLEAAGFSTGAEKGVMTPETEAALRAYQKKYGLPVTGVFDEKTQSSLVAGRVPTPGDPTDGQSVPGGTAPGGSPR